MALLIATSTACSRNAGVTSPSPSIAGPYRLAGSVSTAARQPIGGAAIAVLDASPNANAGKRTTTDGSGRYTLTGLSYAPFSISISAPGYFTETRSVFLTDDVQTSTIDVTLLGR